MTRALRQIRDGYRFGGAFGLPNRQLERLVGIFENPVRETPPVLGGREAVSRVRLEGVGPVVVKHYRRGGLIGRAVRRTYVRMGKPRCQQEFEQLDKVRRMGISAPEPVAYAFRGVLLYRAWLILKEIAEPQSLVRVSRTSAHRTRIAMSAVVEQVSRLIDHKVRHRDFHPGNVLVDGRDRVFIIDFDRADTYRGSRKKLAEQYVRRWCRAVEKHDLPAILIDLMEIPQGFKGLKR